MKDVNKVTAVILAAGRGSRLLSLTDNIPKGLVYIAGNSLIHWQTESLRAAGITSIIIVTGYRGDAFDYLNLQTIANNRWDRTNMVGSIMCALEKIDGPLIFSYSDILYHPNIVRKLLECDADFAITYAVDWLDIWSSRFENPLSDAESFKIDDNSIIVEIGKKADDVNAIQGQFMGLFKISTAGAGWIKSALADDSKLRDTLDTTALINMLINNGRAITGIPISGNWMEIDDQHDLELANKMLADRRLDIGVLEVKS